MGKRKAVISRKLSPSITGDVERHRQFEKTLFERRDADWRIKLVLSGYTFMKTGAQGFPDGKSDCSLYRGNPFNDDRCTKSVPYAKAFDANACGYTVFNQKTGDWAEGVYTRVHRDRGIVTAMREWMGLAVQEGNTFGLPAHC